MSDIDYKKEIDKAKRDAAFFRQLAKNPSQYGDKFLASVLRGLAYRYANLAERIKQEHDDWQ